jgi:hypothetical protein
LQQVPDWSAAHVLEVHDHHVMMVQLRMRA